MDVEDLAPVLCFWWRGYAVLVLPTLRWWSCFYTSFPIFWLFLCFLFDVCLLNHKSYMIMVFQLFVWTICLIQLMTFNYYGPYFSDRISISFWVVLTILCMISLDQYSLGLWAAAIVHIQFLCDFISLMLSELILWITVVYLVTWGAFGVFYLSFEVWGCYRSCSFYFLLLRISETRIVLSDQIFIGVDWKLCLW